tara:strand:- start:2288 stop:2854 length:567 start_codon:yes stop_codon:yes gene_type:complete
MAKTKRQKPDQITNPTLYAQPIADGIHHAIKPLDRIANRMELKYGCDRLQSLVSPATAKLFGSAKAKLDQAIQDNNPEDVAKRATVLMKGWHKMDEEASEAGHQPLKPSIWSHTTDDGFKFAVAQGNADAIKAIRTNAEMEGVAVYSLEEIGRILENESMHVVNSIKAVFPDAKVTKVKRDLDDPVPF